MRKAVIAFVAALFLTCLGASHVYAQSDGSVRGTVKDPQGSSVPSAKVSLLNAATNVKQETTTNSDGLFVFPYVPASTYELSIQKEDFEPLLPELPCKSLRS